MDYVRHSALRGRKSLGRAALLMAVMVFLTGCSGLLGGAPREDGAVFSVSGRIHEAGDPARPVAGAEVRLGDRLQISGKDGSYAFSNVPADSPTATLHVDAAGYVSRSVTIVVEGGRALAVDVGLETAASVPGGGDGDDQQTDPGIPSVYEGQVAVSVRFVNAPADPAPADATPRSQPPAGVRPVDAVRRTSVDAHVPGEWIVELVEANPVQPTHLVWAEAGVRPVRQLSDNFYLVAADEADAAQVEARLAAMADVVSFGRNRVVTPVAFAPIVPNDEYYFRQWSLPLISTPYAWALTTGSRSVVVAVLDTGLVPHGDIDAGAIVHGRNFVGDQTGANYRDNTNNFSHGTMVTGIIGARTNNRTGVAGLNWDVTIMPVRVMSSNGGGSIAGVGDGIKWAVDNGAHIINMSLAWDGNPNDAGERYVRQQIERAAARGVVMVAGAGNDNGRITMPAAHPDVIAVGAVDMNKRRAWYSNYGPELDLVAPGGDQPTDARYREGVLSTDIAAGQPYYTYSIGTSFAAPHVTGVVALMYSRGITDPFEIREILLDTAEDLGPRGFDVQYGYGLVNAYAAVAGVRRTDAAVGVYTADGRVYGPVHPQSGGGEAVARVEGVPPGAQTVFAWIDVNGDGRLDDGDFGAVVDVLVPEQGMAEADIWLQIVHTMSAPEKERLAAAVGRLPGGPR